MTQSEEAIEAMSCVRCGRFSGPERLCAACDDAMALEHMLDVEADVYAAEGERQAQEAWLHGYDTGAEGLMGVDDGR